MQNYLNKINTYCKKWKLKINISKTKKISFGHITRTTTQYMIDNTPLENVKEIKFLGLYLDENLNFNYHTTKIISKASSTIPLLLNMNNTKFPININTKRKIFLSSTRSILEYGHVALITNNVKNYKKIEIFQRKCLRIITQKNWTTPNDTLYNITNTTTIKERHLSLAKKWYNKAKTNQKNIVSHYHEKDFPAFDNHKTPYHIINSQ